MNVLGIWDGHDSGAAILRDGRLVAAVNEERLTRRKLEVRFPDRAIECCLAIAGLQPSDIDVVAASTSDPAKTLARWFPSTKEAYYAVRRRTVPPGAWSALKRRAKYRITEWAPNRPSRGASAAALRRELRRVGLRHARLALYDHHRAHAASAAFASGFDECLVVTVDGVGDGVSATVNEFRGGQLKRLATTPARDSLGVFFEHVTNLLNMRELEDEGKVMALADYAAPVLDDANPLLALVRVDGLRVSLGIPAHALRKPLKRILWHYPTEQFAQMAQRTLEVVVPALVVNAARQTGLRNVALAGGVASNVKVNRQIRLLADVDEVYVFPHMGDGGLAVGAALLTQAESGAPLRLDCSDLGLGPAFSEAQMEHALGEAQLPHGRPPHAPDAVADLLLRDRVVLWFQGRMEYGPRALGNRSVLARPDRLAVRDRLNLVLKRRVWYQPFCPSLFESDARAVFSDWKGTPDRQMTMAYGVKAEHRAALAGTLNVDGSCRPQIVPDAARGVFPDLLRAMKRQTGMGAVLNTSFNIHGEPMVCSPSEAIDVYRRSGADALLLGPFLVQRDHSSCSPTPPT